MGIETLNEDLELNIPMFDDDMDIIAKLDDEPNAVGGLTAAELKAEFDRPGKTIQRYLNETLVPSLIGTVAEESVRSQNEYVRVTKENQRIINEEARERAEQAREDKTSGIVAQATEQAKKAEEQAKLAGQVKSIQAEAETVSAESDATAEVVEENGNLLLRMGIPRGKVGPQGPVGPRGPQGIPGNVDFDALTPEQQEMLKGERGLAIYRTPRSWVEADLAADTYPFSALQMPADYIPKEQDLVLTANNYLVKVSEVNEDLKTVVVVSFSPAVNLNGKQGPVGPAGADGSAGKDGVTFTPSVSSAGVLSWTNDGGKQNPSSVNIKGPAGSAGKDGARGKNGERGLAIYRATKPYTEWTSELFEFTDFIIPAGYVPRVNDLVITSNNYLCYVYSVNDVFDAFTVASFTPPVNLNGGQGPVGPAGQDGDTPYIGNNGNWWIGGTDTGVSAGGGGGSGGASVQADWSENDETKLSYVRGRTHWKETPAPTVFVEEENAAFAGESRTFIFQDFSPFRKDIVGKTFEATWKGEVYTMQGEAYAAYAVVGNKGLAFASEVDTGEPCCFVFEFNSAKPDRSDVVTVYRAPGKGERISYKLARIEPDIYHELEPGYLPDGVPYTEESLVELLPEVEIAIDPDSMTGIIPVDPPELAVGQTYAVTWNGTAYECVGQEFNTPMDDGSMIYAGVCLGDLGGMMGGESTGEPFIFVVIDPAAVETLGVTNMIMALDGSTSATMRIAMRREIVHPVPGKFLPDYLPRIENKGMEILPETTIGSGTEEAGPFNVKGFVWEDGVAYDVTINDTVYRYVVKQNIGTSGLLCMEYVLVDNKGTLRLGPISFYGGGVYIYVRYAKSGDRIKIEGPIRYYKLNAMLAPETTAPLVLIWGEDSTGTLSLNANEREVLEAVRSYRPVILWDASNGNASATCYTFSYWSGGESFKFYSPCAGNKNASVNFDSAEVGTVTFGN